MKDHTKYQGVIPAFYACYGQDGSISAEGVKALTRHLIAKGVKGVYVGGSSGECIYQHPDERKAVLEAVMSEARGKITVIAHVACNNTADSVELAAHAEACGVDAIAAIPPIYFHLPEYAIADYWNAMSAAAPHTEFVIYNIPQLAGTALTMSLLRTMLQNPNVVAVKNSSMPTQDIQMFKDAGIAARGQNGFVVFNGPDEQFVSGLAMGADGGIGGTYAVMPELFLKMYECSTRPTASSTRCARPTATSTQSRKRSCAGCTAWSWAACAPPCRAWPPQTRPWWPRPSG